jgi:hypothetical protein
MSPSRRLPILTTFLLLAGTSMANAATIDATNYGSIWHTNFDGTLAHFVTATNYQSNHPELYGVDGGAAFHNALQVVDQPILTQTDQMAGIGVATFSLSSFGGTKYQNYTLNLGEGSYTGGANFPMNVIDLYAGAGDGLVTTSDYDQGKYVGQFNVGLGNNQLDVSGIMTVLTAANVDNVEFYLRGYFPQYGEIEFASASLTSAGPVMATPLPGALPLFGAGLLSLGFLKRKKKPQLNS